MLWAGIMCLSCYREPRFKIQRTDHVIIGSSDEIHHRGIFAFEYGSRRGLRKAVDESAVVSYNKDVLLAYQKERGLA